MYVALPNNCINMSYNACKSWKCLLEIVSDQNHQINIRITLVKTEKFETVVTGLMKQVLVINFTRIHYYH